MEMKVIGLRIRKKSQTTMMGIYIVNTEDMPNWEEAVRRIKVIPFCGFRYRVLRTYPQHKLIVVEDHPLDDEIKS